MAIIREKCPECNVEIDVHVGDLALGGIRWWKSYFCANCGTRIEADGPGQAPEPARQAIMRDHGIWQLTVSAVGSQKIVALKILRAALEWSLADISQFSKRIPGAVTTGTQAEMECLRKQLDNEKVPATVTQLKNE